MLTLYTSDCTKKRRITAFYRNNRKYARITFPRIIRYHPKIRKLWLRTNAIKPLITSKLTAKATTHPANRTPSSNAEKCKPTFRTYFSHFKALAPNITGIAIKKLNSAATGRAHPSKLAPRMVEPLREVPGIRASI